MEVLDCQQKMLMKWKLLQIFNETKISLEGDRYMSEEMKSKIIKYAMRKIGTQRISILDGMTLEYENKWYNIYVNGNEVTVEEIQQPQRQLGE